MAALLHRPLYGTNPAIGQSAGCRLSCQFYPMATTQRRMSLIRVRLTAGFIALAVFLPAGTLVYAQSSVTQSVSTAAGLPASANMTSAQSNTSSATTTAPNPYGCFGRSDVPHDSHHIPGNITAQVIAQCDVRMPNITAYGDLERALGLGLTKTVDTDDDSQYESSYVHTNPGAPFPVSYRSLYLIYGTSTATDADGTMYVAYTSNQAWVTP